ncbi:MAG: hypothetical protein KBS72_00950 [Bacteroidales bacterium]|nr:hypothetical protein [Candidatus Cacconaster scatequi]
MKKSFLLISLVWVAALTISCKNTKNAGSNEESFDAATLEAAKVELADDVLNTLENLAAGYIDAADKMHFDNLLTDNLTEKEKMVTPDYLLDPSVASNMLTRLQKTNALAILVTEYPIRIAYGMPVGQSKEAIAKLVVDLNHPIDLDGETSGAPIAERTKQLYENCKERGELNYFWQFAFACQSSLLYLISNNPDKFFNSIDETSYQNFGKHIKTCLEALKIYAQYDAEIASVLAFWESNGTSLSEADYQAATSKEGARKIFSERKENLAQLRNSLLQ